MARDRRRQRDSGSDLREFVVDETTTNDYRSPEDQQTADGSGQATKPLRRGRAVSELPLFGVCHESENGRFPCLAAVPKPGRRGKPDQGTQLRFRVQQLQSEWILRNRGGAYVGDRRKLQKDRRKNWPQPRPPKETSRVVQQALAAFQTENL